MAPIKTKKPKTPPLKKINLALQGGGAHGAFAWGVLDKLLEDARCDIEAISATSAGAMNAVVMAYGMSLGGREGAREKLAEFWFKTSEAGKKFSPIKASPWEKMMGIHTLEQSPTYFMFEMMSHAFSPYQLNPLNLNPLRDVLEDVVDFDRLCTCPNTVRLHLAATNVKSGKVRIFQNREITSNAVLASACLPFMFQAVEIDGEHYWDGGYMGNPAIYPLIYRTHCEDIIVVHINPMKRDEVPHSASEIYNRINEISFNSSLIREMRAIAFVSKLIDDGHLEHESYKKMRVHSIVNDEIMQSLGVASKLNSDWDFLVYLRDEGRKTAEAWLTQNFDKIGVESSIDIREMYL